MSPVLCEILRSGFMINSSLIRRSTHLVQSFSVVFLYWIRELNSRYFMASSSGNSSGLLQNSGSESGLTDQQRKRKRMQSNRESARRSRMRKQQQLNELLAESDKLKKDNAQISSTIDVTAQQFVRIEADNSVLRAQVSELSQRLDSLNEIIDFINANAVNSNEFDFVENSNPWNMMMMDFNHNIQQPIMASAGDMFGY
ncbi:hypothetical protein OSB04_005137 [Centaurea solstitialis]|uniref:BZIP domain-containing protein n=1 Tax=Centaurea solstitialis TaxID=347529 RepID=A0AA38TYH0_9ASTR|nr:hypothetical protein OSB04_005137 [Centaurea solstitialis]